MKIEYADFNNFQAQSDPTLVQEVETALSSAPLFIKKSAQTGHTNRWVFSPVATNNDLEQKLHPLGWKKIPVPRIYRAYGIDIDFGKTNMLVEAQFSNYPFFTNNIVRTNILYNAKTALPPIGVVGAIIIITKSKLFEAANSTLYYEQAVNQMTLMMQHSPIQIPLRIIGITADRGVPQTAMAVTFHKGSYSRTVVKEDSVTCQVGDNVNKREREKITVI